MGQPRCVEGMGIPISITVMFVVAAEGGGAQQPSTDATTNC